MAARTRSSSSQVCELHARQDKVKEQKEEDEKRERSKWRKAKRTAQNEARKLATFFLVAKLCKPRPTHTHNTHAHWHMIIKGLFPIIMDKQTANREQSERAHSEWLVATPTNDKQQTN